MAPTPPAFVAWSTSPDAPRSLAKDDEVPAYLYVIECRDGHHYVGMVSELGWRLPGQRRGWVRVQEERLPVRLVHFEA